MGGAFGGLLSLLGMLGLLVQKGCRIFLWLLIGQRAFDWSLGQFSCDHRKFNDQRFIREVLGGFVVVFLELALGSMIRFSAELLSALIVVQVLIFLIVSAVRKRLES